MDKKICKTIFLWIKWLLAYCVTFLTFKALWQSLINWTLWSLLLSITTIPFLSDPRTGSWLSCWLIDHYNIYVPIRNIGMNPSPVITCAYKIVGLLNWMTCQYPCRIHSNYYWNKRLIYEESVFLFLYCSMKLAYYFIHCQHLIHKTTAIQSTVDTQFANLICRQLITWPFDDLVR